MPSILSDLVSKSKCAFRERDIRREEASVLNRLGWRVYIITPVSFLHRFLHDYHAANQAGPAPAADASYTPLPSATRAHTAAATKEDPSRSHSLKKRAIQLLELTVDAPEMACWPASQLAASSLHLARKHLGHSPPWPPALADCTGYSAASLRELDRIITARMALTGKKQTEDFMVNWLNKAQSHDFVVTWLKKAQSLLSPATLLPPMRTRKAQGGG